MPQSSLEHHDEGLNRSFQQFITALHRIDSSQVVVEKPMVFGFALELDTEGRPVLQNFGMDTDRNGIRRPYVKISEEFTERKQETETKTVIGYHLIFEIPGVKKENVDIQTRGRLLTVQALGRNRKYMSTIRLPEGINPSATTAIFENGLLKLQLKLLKPHQREAARITLE